MHPVRTLGAMLALVIVTWLPDVVAAQTLGELFRQVTPSVVVIRASGREIGASGEVRFSQTGSGVLISADGKVMTAAHVVHTMDEISVELVGGATVKAKVIASEPAADVSLLQLESVPAGARPATMADSDTVQVGDGVIIVGAPYGLSYSLSNGIISARWAPNTIYRSMPLAEFLQTTATINTGNSGGPMFNMKGEVIGIVSHNISRSGGSEGLGFVITANTARRLLLERKSFWNGLEGEFLPGDIAELLNLPPNTTGFLVKTVAKGSPADTMGLRGGRTIALIEGREFVLGGDIVLSLMGLPVSPSNVDITRDELGRLNPGDPVKAVILRAGRIIDVTGVAP
jgi:S1-C subfamily serine protease